MTLHVLPLVPRSLVSAIVAVAAAVASLGANQIAAPPRLADGHPDLNGIWATDGGIPNFPVSRSDGSISITGPPIGVVRSRAGGPGRAGGQGAAPGPTARPAPNVPSYKPEFRAKVKELLENESKVDAVFFCGRPGLPRLGPPQQVVQTPGQVVFLYEDLAGQVFRVIPTDGRAHRTRIEPSYSGDSVGHWEGDTLVVEARNFVEHTWLGEGGYFHTSALKVIEKLHRDGDRLVYQAIADDPSVLIEPWVMTPVNLKRSTVPLEESLDCKEVSSPHLLNNDHHGQR